MSDSHSDNKFTHFDDKGDAVMVDVGGKVPTRRIATAGGSISMNEEAFKLIKSGEVKKGDVLGVARVAGIMAAKKTVDLIPLAHPLLINKVNIEFSLSDEYNTIHITATVAIDGKTGVEMEALTAVSVTALTIYDMCKAVDKSMTINDIRLLKKTGGKSGEYIRK